MWTLRSGTAGQIFFGSQFLVRNVFVIRFLTHSVLMTREILSFIIDFIKVVFCSSEKGVIEFRDQNNLDNILYTYSVAPQKPALLCPVSRSVLLYLCGTVVKPELRWLDCSTNQKRTVRKISSFQQRPYLGVYALSMKKRIVNLW